MASKALLIQNLHKQINEYELNSMFSKHGDIQKVSILGTNPKIAVIFYKEAGHASRALQKVKNQRYQGKKIEVSYYVQKQESDDSAETGEVVDEKPKKLQKQLQTKEHKTKAPEIETEIPTSQRDKRSRQKDRQKVNKDLRVQKKQEEKPSISIPEKKQEKKNVITISTPAVSKPTHQPPKKEECKDMHQARTDNKYPPKSNYPEREQYINPQINTNGPPRPARPRYVVYAPPSLPPPPPPPYYGYPMQSRYAYQQHPVYGMPQMPVRRVPPQSKTTIMQEEIEEVRTRRVGNNNIDQGDRSGAETKETQQQQSNRELQIYKGATKSQGGNQRDLAGHEEVEIVVRKRRRVITTETIPGHIARR